MILVAGALLIGGCPGAEDAPNANDAGRVAPGAFFSIADPTLRRGDVVEVRFQGPGGYSVIGEAYADRDGRARVAAPTVLHGETGELISATVTATVVGGSGSTSIDVGLPRELRGAKRGDVFRSVLNGAIADLDASIAQWTAVGDELAEVDVNGMVTQMGTQRTLLADTLLQLDVTGTLQLRNSDGSSSFVHGEALDLAERILAGQLAGAAAEAHGDLDAAKRLAYAESDEPIDPDQLARDLNFLRSTPAARDVAGKFGTAVSLSITIISLPVVVGASETVVVTSAIIAAGVGAYSFFSAWASNQNSDAFLNRTRAGFDATTELISQFARYAANALSAGIGRLGDIGNASTILIGLKDLGAEALLVRCQAEAQALFCTTGTVTPPDDDPIIGDGSATRFVVLFYQNFDGSSGTNAALADIKLGGGVSAPDFTWSGFPFVLTLTVEETRNQSATPLYGVVAGLDGEGNPFPIVSGIMYGDYSRLARLPGYPETAPLLQRRVGSYIITIAAEGGAFASLLFDVE